MSSTRSMIPGVAGTKPGRRARWARLARVVTLLGVLLPTGSAFAVEVGVPVAEAAFTERPPEIDGILDEPQWAEATPIGPLTQVEPIEGAAPGKRTEVRILTDEDNLYIGIRCFDDEADGIIARNMLRDANVRSEDRIGLVLDTFYDKRNGYFFQTNALGARVDGLIEDARLQLNWDGIWNVKTQIDTKGWTAELVIPFKTLNFQEGNNAWGMNFLRGIRGSQERDNWADPYQNKLFTDMGRVGVLRGMARARQGLGLDVVPSVAINRVDDARQLSGEGKRRHYTEFRPSGDVRYKITPSLTATGTVNTDFGQTPIDDVQVNLSRFSLFFPEKREFFLQDQGIFDFANIGQDAQPFFSRRIGLSDDGDEVPVRGGGKLTGRIGPLNVGALVVHQRSQENQDDPAVTSNTDVPPKTLAVARVKLNVGEESTVGLVGTYGDPQSRGDNWLVGADLNYRTSRLFDDKVLEAGAWFQKSHSHGDGVQCARDPDGLDERSCDSENAYGIGMTYPNDRVNWNFVVQRIEEDFRPRLGFTRRQNILRYRGSWRYRWRPETWIQTVDNTSFVFVGTDGDEPDTVRESFVRQTLVDVHTLVGDRLFAYGQFDFQREPADRTVFDNVVLPKGKHYFGTGGLAVEASRSRPVSGALELFGGSYYDGSRVGLISRIQWEPIRQLLFALSYRHVRHWGLDRASADPLCNDESDVVAAPCGNSFTVRIATARAELQLSPDLSWNNLVQYDNASDEMSFQSRIRWTITPGSDLFLILNQGFLAEEDTLKAGRTEPLVKLTWTFRF